MCKYIYVCVLCGLLNCSCNMAKSESYSDGRFTIDIDNAQQMEKESFSSIFKNVGCIVLETTDNSLLNRVDRIAFLDDYLYVLERGRGLFQFNKSGKFLKMIGDKGIGPGEYMRPSDLTVDAVGKKIYLLDSQAQTVLRYNMNGEYENSVKLKNSKTISNYIQYFNGELYTDLYSFENSDESCLLSKIDINTGSRIALYLRASQYNKGWNELFFTERSWFISSLMGNPKFMHLFMDTIFEIGKEGPMPYITLQSKNLTTKEYMISQREKGYDASKIYDGLTSAGMIYNVTSFFESDKYIHFKYNFNNKLYTVLHRKDMDSTFIYQRMVNDLLYSDNSKNMLVSKFVAYDKDRVYTIEMNTDLSKEYFLENLRNNNISHKMGGAEGLNMLTEESNPVIVYYEFK